LKIEKDVNLLDFLCNILKEPLMNNLPPEIMVELNRRRIKEEIDAIRLQEEAGKGKNLLSKNLAALGEWMVDRGETLRKRYSSIQTSSSEFTKRVA
jgi:hypothetical protein